MKKSFIALLCAHTLVYGSFMDKIGDIVESTLSDDEQGVSEVKSVRTDFDKHTSKEKGTSLLDDVMNGVKSTIGIKEKKKEKHNIAKDTITAMKEVVGLKKIKKDHRYFDGGIMGEMADMIDLEKGDVLGLPSVFGLNKKKDTKVFGSTILGDTLLGDVKETGTSFYKGFKTTGESAELMSGMMYKSSKLYNGMFHIFDASPFNVFEDKDEKSFLDVFEKGNKVLDILD